MLDKDIRQKPEDLPSLKLFAKIFLVRCSEFVFGEARAEVFRDFLGDRKIVEIKSILCRIGECKDLKLLNSLIAKIKLVHFE